MVRELTRIRQLLESMVEEGVVEPLKPRTVTTRAVVVQPPYRRKWFGILITNDGPDSVYVQVNTEKSSEIPQEIKVDETWGVKFSTAVIEDARFYTESGTAVVRIRGVR